MRFTSPGVTSLLHATAYQQATGDWADLAADAVLQATLVDDQLVGEPLQRMGRDPSARITGTIAHSHTGKMPPSNPLTITASTRFFGSQRSINPGGK